jgi:hypothetical protein
MRRCSRRLRAGKGEEVPGNLDCEVTPDEIAPELVGGVHRRLGAGGGIDDEVAHFGDRSN